MRGDRILAPVTFRVAVQFPGAQHVSIETNCPLRRFPSCIRVHGRGANAYAHAVTHTTARASNSTGAVHSAA